AAAARMNGDTAPSGPVGIGELPDLAFDPALLKRIGDDAALPGAVGVALPVLDGAAAAAGEISAERRDPLGAGLRDRQEMPALGMTVRGRHFDDFAAERVGHVDAEAVGDSHTVAAMADVVDHKPCS